MERKPPRDQQHHVEPLVKMLQFRPFLHKGARRVGDAPALAWAN